ncbi:MAG: hypothetical protein AAF441_27710 [Pseudomonadota bacterium]
MNQAMRPLLTTMILLAGTGAAQADDPKAISKDFCYAVAAQALCDKTFTMKKGTEARLQSLAGQKLRGEGEALHKVCNSGYNEFYTLEGSEGLQKACARTMELYGPNGTRRAGLVQPRGKPAMKLPEKQVGATFLAACYSEAVAKDCPTLNMVAGHEQRLQAKTGVPASEKLRYFSTECGRGAFRAANAKHKVTLNAFCRAGLASYGPNGTAQPGWLTGTVEAAEAPKAEPVKPAFDAKKITENAQAAANKALAETVDGICTAINTAKAAAGMCPGVTAVAGLENLLQVHLGNQVGSISERCAAAKTPQVTASSKAAFCRSAIASYGPKGTDLPNMLQVQTAAATDHNEQMGAEVTAAAAPATGQERVILDAVPARPANFDAAKALGRTPGTLAGAECQPYTAAFADAQAAMNSATTLKDKVTASIELAMAGMVGQALCPAEISFTPSTGVADAVKATGLEACHIVDAAARTARDKARPHRRDRRYRALNAYNSAVVWAYETYLPTCSKLMKRRVESSLKFARDTVKRNGPINRCSAWTVALRAEMKTAGNLARDRRAKEAIGVLDTSALAALYGVQENCDEARGKYPTESWLVTRKRFQLRL